MRDKLRTECLFLITTLFLVLSFPSANARNSSAPSTPASRKFNEAFISYLRSYYRAKILHCAKPEKGPCREADDDDLQYWLGTFSDSDGHGLLRTSNIRKIVKGEKSDNKPGLGNGFGARDSGPWGVPYVLPATGGLDEVYIAAEYGSDFKNINQLLEKYKEDPISYETTIDWYEPRLRRRMDSSANGKVSEDEWVDYVTKNFDYKPILSRNLDTTRKKF
jgi:hypothetical protein